MNPVRAWPSISARWMQSSTGTLHYVPEGATVFDEFDDGAVSVRAACCVMGALTLWPVKDWNKVRATPGCRRCIARVEP